MSNQCETQHYYTGAVIDGRYRLVNFIGAGGMACVYKAHEENSPHRYAIKFLKTEFHNQPYLIEYFRDEASSMRDLAHPNIVRFYRFVNTDDYSYIIMDYVDGFALSDIIRTMYKRKQAIPLDEVVRIMAQTARALDAIHREGYVHRDIKPSNVLIDRKTGQAFLTDLGITSATNTRMEGAGTLAYMPPELIETWVADARSDQYAYAIMVFEMLAKRRPFVVEEGLTGSEAEADMLMKQKSAPVPDITNFRSDLPRELNAIFAKALSKNPDDRYETILDFARAIHSTIQSRLSPELQDFSTVQHRQIAEPTQNPQSPILRTVASALGVLVIALVSLVTFLVTSAPAPVIATPSSVAIQATLTATDLPPTATATETETPVPTATPNPIEGQSVYPLLTGVDALAELDSLLVPLAEDGALQYLRVGMVNGFSATLQAGESVGVNRYGLAFRVQDNQNYLYFVVNPTTLNWRFGQVVDGTMIDLDTGTIVAFTGSITINALDDFIQIISGETTLSYNNGTFSNGSLAVFVEGTTDATLQLERLEISLLGTEAESAFNSTPTPSAGIADVRRFLRTDIDALLATNNVLNSAINCPAYISVYERLERHQSNQSSEVRNWAEETILAGAIIYERCRSESPSAPLSFTTTIQDYLDWESALRAIRAQLGD